MIRAACAAAACLFAASASSAIVYTIPLTNGNEPGLVVPTLSGGGPRSSSGTATFTFNDALTQLTFEATIFGLDVTGSQSADVNDNLTAAHIHAGPGVAPGVNGPVVWGFFGSPQNNNNPSDGGLVAFGPGLVGGTFKGTWDLAEGNNTTLALQLPNLLAGRAYINFHSAQFGGGEIRGNLVNVPEPGTGALMLGGGLALAFVAMRRRRGSQQWMMPG